MLPVFDARKFSSCITFPSTGIALNAEETEDSVSAERSFNSSFRSVGMVLSKRLGSD